MSPSISSRSSPHKNCTGETPVQRNPATKSPTDEVDHLFASRADCTVAHFWPQSPASLHAFSSTGHPLQAAANLYDLFVHELSALVAGACQTDQVARRFFAKLSPNQVRLRRLVLGLAQSACACLPALPSALIEQGLDLLSANNSVVDVLLTPIDPGTWVDSGTEFVEPRSVTSARAVSAFTHVTLYFQAAATHAAEDARVLGSDQLYRTLHSWAATWSAYLRDLRRRENTFRAQAYAAGLNSRALRQSA